jgi:hypothetical protein
MEPIRQQILRLLERAGYVVTHLAEHNRRQELIVGLETDLGRQRELIGRLEEDLARQSELVGRLEEDLARQSELVGRLDTDRTEQHELNAKIGMELHRRDEIIAQLRADLQRAQAALSDGLAQERDRARCTARDAARRLAEADREYRLGRDRDARELERARADAWAAKEAAAGLQQQLGRLR